MTRSPSIFARVMVTGAAGQLGGAIREEFSTSDLRAYRHADLDITDSAAVTREVSSFRPTAIINCAAYNQVDAAEDDAQAALMANAFGVRTLAQAGSTCEATLVHYSSDFVFDGKASRPYTESDLPNPASFYGFSKLLGEWFALEYSRAFVLRVASLFGGASAKSSVDRIVEALEQGQVAKVFTDRTASPSYVIDVAKATRTLMESAEPGLYHCVGTGCCTWQELGREAAGLLGKPERQLDPIRAAELPLAAARPQFAALSNEKLRRFWPMPTWQDALARYLRTRRT